MVLALILTLHLDKLNTDITQASVSVVSVLFLPTVQRSPAQWHKDNNVRWNLHWRAKKTKVL